MQYIVKTFICFSFFLCMPIFIKSSLASNIGRIENYSDLLLSDETF